MQDHPARSVIRTEWGEVSKREAAQHLEADGRQASVADSRLNLECFIAILPFQPVLQFKVQRMLQARNDGMVAPVRFVGLAGKSKLGGTGAALHRMSLGEAAAVGVVSEFDLHEWIDGSRGFKHRIRAAGVINVPRLSGTRRG
ncbi:MAG: hypothetical protein Q7P63_17225 [Verrucomicrobiota bacterium JB022]|nr:hypothetical protein [Verrucomicrobiota bacterium JB022]